MTSTLAELAQAERETAELRAEVERLRLERDEARAQFDAHVAWASDQDLTLRAEVEQLRLKSLHDDAESVSREMKALIALRELCVEAAKVLRPFAEVSAVPTAVPDGAAVDEAFDFLLTYGHLRAAAALLAKLEAGEAGRTFADGVEAAERALLDRWWAMTLVISSAVRCADPRWHEDVTALILDTQEYIKSRPDRALARGGKEG